MSELIQQLFETIEELENKIKNQHRRFLGLQKRVKKLENNKKNS